MNVANEGPDVVNLSYTISSACNTPNVWWPRKPRATWRDAIAELARSDVTMTLAVGTCDENEINWKKNEAGEIISVWKINVYCEWLTWKAILKSLGFRILPSLHLRAGEGKGQGGGPGRHWLCGSNEEQLTCQTEGLARITREQYKLVMWLAPGMVSAGVSENTLMVERCRPHCCDWAGYKLNISNSFSKLVLRLHIFYPFFWYCLFSSNIFSFTPFGKICCSR